MLKTCATENRPWGSYTILQELPFYKVKKIEVNPGQKLSLQSHSKRNELWQIVEGNGLMTLDDTIYEVNYGEIISIEIMQKHRIENTGSTPLVFIEIQTGTYFGEDDIIRYEDNYG